MNLILDNWFYVILIIVGSFVLWKYKDQLFGGGESISKKAVLGLFTEDLTAKAKRGDLNAVIGRESELDRVIQILCRKTKNNPLLIGEPGVGKTAIVEGLAVKIVTDNVPESLKGKSILSLNLADLISGTKYRGEFESRIRHLINQVIEQQDHVILFIDEIHMLVQSKGTEGAINISDILKPALARGELHAIGATTSKEYEQYIKADEPLERRFQPVIVEEPTVEMTINILESMKEGFEKYHNVEISAEAINAAANLADKFIKQRLLPDKAIDLIDEAGASVSLRSFKQPDSAVQLINEAASSLRSKINQAPDELKKLLKKLNALKKKQTKIKDEKELKNCNEEVVELVKEIEDLENKYKEEKLKGVRPVVTELEIKKIVAAWVKLPIKKLTY